MTTICYKVKTGRSYLAYYTYSTVAAAQNEVERLNREKPTVAENRMSIDWTNVVEFFVHEQDAMGE